MARYRKKPVEIEAWQVGSDEPIPWWIREELGTINGLIVPIPNEKGFSVFDAVVFNDWMPAYAGYYMVREGSRFFVCSEEVFEQAYEVVK